MSAATLPSYSVGTAHLEASGVLAAVPLIPRNLGLAVLQAYRTVVSPLYGDVCKYYPSCSAYALEAVTVHGAWRGTGLALRRLGHCHPWSLGGYDPVPGTVAAHAWAAVQAAGTTDFHSSTQCRGAT